MEKIYKFIIAAVASVCMSILVSSSAMAMSGFSVGIISNDSTFDTSGSEKEGTEVGSDSQDPETNSIASVKNDVDFGSAFIEYSAGTDGPGLGMTLGIEYIPGKASLGSKSRTDTDNDTSDDADTGTYTASAKVHRHVSLYFEPTMNLHQYFGVYGKLGVSTVVVKSLEDISKGASSSAYGDARTWGGMYGFGAKLASPWGIFIKAEATTTRYGTVQMQSDSGNRNIIRAKPEQESARIAIGYNF